MSEIVNDVYGRMTMSELFKEWNESNATFPARNEIRRRLGWKKGLDLWTLIESHCSRGQDDLPFDPEPNPPSPIVANGTHQFAGMRTPRRSGRIDYAKLFEMIDSKEGKVTVIVEPMLSTGWDFVDIRPEGKGYFDRDPESSQEFLEDMREQDLFIDELSDSQIGLLTALFRAWRYWHRRS